MNTRTVSTRFVLGLATLAVVAFSMPPSASAVCGDGVIDAGEDCDLGGTCVGGAAAGTACHVGDTTCTGGICTTFGGKGCAANCTTEHDVPYSLLPGVLDGLTVAAGTSGVAIASDFLSIPLPFGPACNGGSNAGNACASDADCPGATCVQSQQTLTVGKEKDGKIPVVVKASSVQFPGIPVSTLACGCIRGIASKTCGGSFFLADGQTLSPNCTPGFTTCTTPACNTSGEPCAGQDPCAFVHGDGNTAAGEIGCEGGLDGIDLSFTQDSAGFGGPPQVILSGHGGPGSALAFQTLGITAALGACTGTDPSTYGPDGIFCTADDPPGGILAAVGTVPAATGTATAVVLNANGADGVNLGPVSATGAPFSCAALESPTAPSAAGGGLVAAFTFIHLETVGDVAVTAQLFALPCGNGILDPGEQCDDGNTVSGDGCSSTCQVEPCFTCSGQPSTCTPASAGTPCSSNGSCSSSCNGAGVCTQTAVSDGTQCTGSDPNLCMNACVGGTCAPGTPVTQSACCGNGILDPGEQCDDGNLVDGDGCDTNCTFPGCGNGILDPGEQCDDGNLVNGDGCDSNCQLECHDTCVTGTQLFPSCGACAASICAGDPFCCAVSWDDICVSETLSICSLSCCGESTCQLDHFQCYSGRTLAAQPPTTVTVADALTSFTARVRGLRDLCTPTDQNGEDPGAVSHPDHLESYTLAPENPKLLRSVLPLRNQTVVNQFGALQLDVLWPNRLLVPTAKSLTESPPAPGAPAVDHFTCYQVKPTKGAPGFPPIANVTLDDQFGPATVTVGRPTRLCLPTNTNNGDPAAATHNDRLLCYRVSGGFTPIGRVFTNNQFGPGIFYPRARDELCVPSVMTP